ncbi:MAG: phosphate regulon sensor histidine kinase PhoR [Gammaproteobacteria bacterium]|nr:phosphate regulon sensor histidine kinase PhoR [Gammaproteobacteria bacterium]MBI5616836.1 phosphate regulon sensor histidine kinase PhoR [Gammaproteobacteria bacterium]
MPKDIWRLSLIAALAVVIGAVGGFPGTALAVAGAIYIAWTHRNLRRLLSWVRDPKNHEPPEHEGIFEELTLEIDYLRERHKKRKKKLQNYLKQFQQATRALPDATVVLDEDGAVQWANDAAGRYLGIRWPDDVNQRITNLVRLPALRDFVLERDETKTIEITSPTDPNRHLSVLLAPYSRNQWLFVARDVTQLHRANQIRSDFVANVSHELRTPITVFRGYLETMERQTEVCPPTWRTPLVHMAEHAERMQLLVEELLLLSRLEQEPEVKDPQPVAVGEMLAEIQKQARRLSGGREHIFTLEAEAALRILGAEQEIYSAFSNLVFNAVHYTPTKGVIKIRWFKDAAGAHFEVQDNGIGIAEEHLDRITERFYRVDVSRARAYGGTGLGLSIVKHVLARHGATLAIKSRLGEGSTFRCDFPPEAIVSPEVVRLSRIS